VTFDNVVGIQTNIDNAEACQQFCQVRLYRHTAQCCQLAEISAANHKSGRIKISAAEEILG
jgi:hypothetical protein